MLASEEKVDPYPESDPHPYQYVPDSDHYCWQILSPTPTPPQYILSRYVKSYWTAPKLKIFPIVEPVPYRTAPTFIILSLRWAGCPRTGDPERTLDELRTCLLRRADLTPLATRALQSLRFLMIFSVLCSHCFICRPSDSIVSEDAGIEPKRVATWALAVRSSNHSALSHPHSIRSHPHSARSHPHLG
jgi:hypothetical protein